MNKEINAYPLTWSVIKPRAKKQKSSRFNSTLAQSRDNLVKEIKLMKATNLIISSNVPVMKNGLPYAQYKEPEDCGVAVYFNWNSKPFCFACDHWDKVKDNLQAIAKTVEALRGIDRWASGDMIEQAFTGFEALPNYSNYHSILNIKETASKSEILEAYRKKAKILHPDNGGSSTEFNKIVEARDKCLTYIERQND